MSERAAEPHIDAGGFTRRHREALSKLGGAQKTTVGEAAYLRWINRPIGGRLAALGYGLGLTPNHLTFVSALFSFGAIAALCLANPTPPVAIVISLALLIGYAFDSADGQLSRVRGGGRPSGEWLDHVVDIAKTASLHTAVATSLYRFADLNAAWLLLPLGFGIVNVTFFFAMMLRDQLGGKPAKAPAGTSASPIKAIALLPMDYGLFGLVIGAIFATPVFLTLYGALALFNLVFTARSLPRAYRVLDASR